MTPAHTTLYSRISQTDEEAHIARGPFPTWMRSLGVYGIRRWFAERLQASKSAKSIADPDHRAEALAHVEEFYGPASGDMNGAHKFYTETVFGQRVEWEAEHFELPASREKR